MSSGGTSSREGVVSALVAPALLFRQHALGLAMGPNSDLVAVPLQTPGA